MQALERMPRGFVPWPAEFADRYVREGYWRGETLGDLLRRAAAASPAATAVMAPGVRWSFAELDARADRLAAGFARRGLQGGDRVVVQLPNVAEFVAVSFALFRLGVMPVYALPAHRRAEIVHLAEAAKAKAYIIPAVHQRFDHRALAREVAAATPLIETIFVAGASEEFVSLDEVAAAPARGDLQGPRPRDIAFFLLSGGTTGSPKLIPRTHDDYAYQLHATAAALEMTPASAYLAALPVAHNAALGCPGVLGTIAIGAKVVLAPDPSPDTTFPLIVAEEVTHTTLMPPLVLMWLEAASYMKEDVSRVLLQVGGAKLSASVAARVHPQLGCRLTHWFGMAEGLLSYTRLDDADEVVLHTTGRPLAVADEIRVVDAEDREVAPGELGQLLTRGPYTLRGYFDAEETNRHAFTDDGFLRTGDLVRIDAAGNMLIEGRVKDVIVRGGEKISAQEIEAHLLEHPDVREAALVDVPDAVMGEKTCAFIVAAAMPPTLPEIKQYLKERGLADYKLPDLLRAVPSLPRTAVGKIDKKALRAG